MAYYGHGQETFKENFEFRRKWDDGIVPGSWTKKKRRVPVRPAVARRAEDIERLPPLPFQDQTCLYRDRA